MHCHLPVHSQRWHPKSADFVTIQEKRKVIVLKSLSPSCIESENHICIHPFGFSGNVLGESSDRNCLLIIIDAGSKSLRPPNIVSVQLKYSHLCSNIDQIHHYLANKY